MSTDSQKVPLDDASLQPSHLCQVDASDLTAALRSGRLSASRLVDASLARIEQRDPSLRAFITVCAQEARQQAEAADRALASGAPAGPLCGLPIAIKDNTRTAGLRTTFGSRAYADHVPAADDLVVSRLRQAGAIILGKTNTPEFASGAVCTNALCGPTANPWNTLYSTGGSSGGSAAAVADGMVALAQGTDMGGSVRTPASFCHIVGFRPSLGRIPNVPKSSLWSAFGMHGLLTRSVRDAALMFNAIAGPDPRDPLSMLGAQPSGAPHRAWRVACSADLGVTAIHSDVRAVFESALDRLRHAGMPLTREHPQTNADAVRHAFLTLGTAGAYYAHHELYEKHRDQLTPSFRWNVERGAGLSAQELLLAEQERGQVYQAFQQFFEHHDILVTVSASVPPFLNSITDVTEIEGEPMRDILDYLRITYLVSLTGLPCLSLPGGFTADGLPVGLQLVAGPGRDVQLLEFAQHLEQLGFAYQVPTSSRAQA
jgi:amidase